MPTDDKLQRYIGEVNPLLASLSIAFWRARLLIEREAKTLPLRLLILSMVRTKDGINPKEIRELLGLESSRISRLIDSLEKAGLLLRERDPQDRRFVQLHLTQKGREFLRERTELVNEEFKQRLEGLLSVKERKELERLLIVMARGVRH